MRASDYRLQEVLLQDFLTCRKLRIAPGVLCGQEDIMEAEKRSCTLDGKVYASGDNISNFADLYVCDDGEWKFRSLDFLYVFGP